MIRKELIGKKWALDITLLVTFFFTCSPTCSIITIHRLAPGLVKRAYLRNGTFRRLPQGIEPVRVRSGADLIQVSVYIHQRRNARTRTHKCGLPADPRIPAPSLEGTCMLGCVISNIMHHLFPSHLRVILSISLKNHRMELTTFYERQRKGDGISGQRVGD